MLIITNPGAISWQETVWVRVAFGPKSGKEWFDDSDLWEDPAPILGKDTAPKASLLTNQRKVIFLKRIMKGKHSKSIPGHKWDKEWFS